MRAFFDVGGMANSNAIMLTCGSDHCNSAIYEFRCRSAMALASHSTTRPMTGDVTKTKTLAQREVIHVQFDAMNYL